MEKRDRKTDEMGLMAILKGDRVDFGERDRKTRGLVLPAVGVTWGNLRGDRYQSRLIAPTFAHSPYKRTLGHQEGWRGASNES